MYHHLAILSPKLEANVKEAALGYMETVMKERAEMPKPSFHSEGTYLKIFAPANAKA